MMPCLLLFVLSSLKLYLFGSAIVFKFYWFIMNDEIFIVKLWLADEFQKLKIVSTSWSTEFIADQIMKFPLGIRNIHIQAVFVEWIKINGVETLNRTGLCTVLLCLLENNLSIHYFSGDKFTWNSTRSCNNKWKNGARPNKCCSFTVWSHNIWPINSRWIKFKWCSTQI